MNSVPLISVIVPIYGVEAYLDRCVESIAGQTYKNLQIILVDDGSPDRCPAMCDTWAEKDSRIQVIHKENGGLSDARNAGMAVAVGTLMAFVDGDDYIRSDMYQLLYQNMRENQSDISACGTAMVWDDGTPSLMLTKSGCYVMDTQEAIQAVIVESWLKQPVWYKLYRTALIRDLMFPVGKYHEDVFWTYQAVAQARKVSVFDTPCYFYVQRSGSIMDEKYTLRRLDAIEAKQQRMQFVQTEFPGLTGLAVRDVIFSCMYHGQLAMKDLSKEQLGCAMKILKKAVGSCGAATPKDLTFTNKCWLWLAKMNLPLACRIRNLLGVGM